jgi:ABC-type sugar transport system ATPase subunit
MIELLNLSIRSGPFLLKSIELRVERGEYVVLMGRSGAGKTTILEAICGLRPVASGAIRLDGVDVTGWDPADRQIGYVPQDLGLFPHLTVREHLEFPLRIRGASRPAQQAKVDELAPQLGLIPLLDRGIAELSGGESQRVALGRALAASPRVLLLDEPLSALDETTRGEMYQLLLAIRQRPEIATIHVTHLEDEARSLGDRIVRLEQGQLSCA